MTELLAAIKKMETPSLVTELKQLVAQERKILTEILHYLNELDRRRLYLELGYTSLFEFAVSELRYTAPAAHRRIEAMKLLRNLPEVEDKLQQGALSLSVVCQTQTYSKKESSRRREEGEGALTLRDKREVMATLEGKSSRECERILADLSPEVALPKEKVEPLSGLPGQYLVQFVADQTTIEAIEQLKGLLAHQLGARAGSLGAVIERLAELGLNRLDPSKRKSRKREPESGSGSVAPPEESPKPAPQRAAPPPTSEVAAAASPSKPLSRYIPASIRKEVWLRDHSRCTEKDHASGKICGSRFAIQIDHLRPFSQGGSHVLNNLALKCARHNRWRAEKAGLLRERFG